MQSPLEVQRPSFHLRRQALDSQPDCKAHSVYLVRHKDRPSPHIGEQLTKLALAEPVGGSSPKFTMKSSVSALKTLSGNPFELSCPAQGSPIPSFRSPTNIFVLPPEPIGGSVPKFTLKRDGERREVLSGSPFDLPCPAQGSPIPSFRSVIQPFSHFQSPSEAQRQSSLLTQKLLGSSVKLITHSVCSVRHKALPFQHLGLPETIKDASIHRACWWVCAQIPN